jgi:hypothetical protein
MSKAADGSAPAAIFLQEHHSIKRVNINFEMPKQGPSQTCTGLHMARASVQPHAWTQGQRANHLLSRVEVILGALHRQLVALGAYMRITIIVASCHCHSTCQRRQPSRPGPQMHPRCTRQLHRMGSPDGLPHTKAPTSVSHVKSSQVFWKPEAAASVHTPRQCCPPQALSGRPTCGAQDEVICIARCSSARRKSCKDWISGDAVLRHCDATPTCQRV